MQSKPWWSLRGEARAKAKAEDAERRPPQPTDGRAKLRNLCRKHGLHFDSSIRAQSDGEKLTLSNGVSQFALTLKLIDKTYLEYVLLILNQKEPNGPPNPIQ